MCAMLVINRGSCAYTQRLISKTGVVVRYNAKNSNATVGDILDWTPEMVEHVNTFSMSLSKMHSQQKLKLNTEHTSHNNN